MKRAAVIALALACASCATSQRPAPATARPSHGEIGDFTGPQGRIRIDTGQLTIAIGETVAPLTDCSNADFHCFRNDALGFHIVAIRACARRLALEGEAVGGAVFVQFAGVPHADARQGRYESKLSDRFSYGWFLDAGLAEIQYDPSGVRRFGADEWYAGNGPSAAWEPYAYWLAEGRSFLRCQGRRH